MSKLRRDLGTSNDRIVAVLYSSPNNPAGGRTLLIDVQSVDRMADLYDLSVNLARGELTSVQLNKLGYVTLLPPLAEITLIGAAESARRSLPRQRVRENVADDGAIHLEWVQSADEWEDTSVLLEPLVEAAKQRRPCHQHLDLPFPDQETSIKLELLE